MTGEAALSTEVVPTDTVAAPQPTPADAAPADVAPATETPTAPAAPRTSALETLAADKLHQLLATGVEKLPDEVESTVSRLAVALSVFGSEMTRKDQDRPATAVAAEAVGLFKALDDKPETQRAVLQAALSAAAGNILGEEKKDQALATAEGGLAMLAKAAQSTGFSAADAVASLKGLAGAFRKDDDADGADAAGTKA